MIKRPDVSSAGEGSIAVGGDLGSASTIHIGTQILSGLVTPVEAAVKDPGPVFESVGLEAFTGRKWLIDAVDCFIAEQPSGYVFIEAEAGLGKTAFAAWLVRNRGYLSHFSRYSGGRSVRAALQNLAAQLVRHEGLDEQAPGGMLPEWVHTPDGFESLLGIAAQRARAAERQLVLVVDGLDEAEHPPGGLPWGLPSLLPRGAYIVGTYRVGRSPGRPDARSATLRIGKGDERNARDIREFLIRTAGEDTIAARLAQARITPDQFADVLAERADGVWVYLRYVLEELRIGLRTADSFSELPAGLREYYADQVRRWQNDPQWDADLLPLLATLAVAGEPLAASALARLAGGLDPAAVRRWCDGALRPLLTATLSETAGLRYEIYHASFREVLKAHHVGRPAWSGTDEPYDLAVIADELRAATIAAHSRIADAYLDGFGGLDAGLPALAERPDAAGVDDGYSLSHLARHLQHGKRTDDLHRLLQAEHDSEGGTVNLWFAAHDRADCIVSYLDDLSRGQEDSASATNRALEASRPAAALGTEIRYALIAATITSRAEKVFDGLLEALLESGAWSTPRGLDHARRLANPRSRFKALLMVYRHADPVEQPGLLDHVRAAADAMPSKSQRAEALGELLPEVPDDQRPSLLAEVTSALAAGEATLSAVLDLAPYADEEQWPTLMDEADSVEYPGLRAGFMTRLMPYASPGQRPAAAMRTLAAILRSADSLRGEYLAALAPCLPGDLVGPALDAASAIDDARQRAVALAALAPFLPENHRAAVLADALGAADGIAKPFDHACAIAAIVPLLPAERQAAVLESTLRVISHEPGDNARARALAQVAAALVPELLPSALETAAAISAPNARAEALTSLLPYMPDDQRATVVAAALAAAGRHARSLVALAPFLSAGQKPLALLDALASVGDSAGDSPRFRALGALAAHLPPSARATTLARLLGEAAAIDDDLGRAGALTELAPYAPESQRRRVLDDALRAASAVRCCRSFRVSVAASSLVSVCVTLSRTYASAAGQRHP